MRKVFFVVSILVVLLAAAFGIIISVLFLRDRSTPEQYPDISYPFMKITSSAFAHNESLPPDHTCDGKGVSPPLAISDVPADAKSLVLLFDDPDAPAGTFDHWVVWNIDTSVAAITQGETPPGVVGKNSGGGNAYFPPCPPTGEHRYTFKLYALDTLLSLPAGSKKVDVERAMEGHVLDSTELIGRYKRK